MKDQLPKEEIQKLFDFVESKNVPYRDVQFEIVDHLASAMEDLKEENPEWPYSLCLEQVYKKFPITGFALLQLEKEEALNKYWKRKLWPYLLEYFKLPKIILTIATFISIQQIVRNIPSIEVNNWYAGLAPNMFLFFAIIMIISLISIVTKKRINHIRGISKGMEQDSKNFLYIKSFNTISHIVTMSIVAAPFYIGTIIPSPNVLTFQGIYSYLIAWLIVGLIIHWHLTLFVFPPLLKEEAEKKYAHIKMRLA
jgi:hypothetical protein